LQKIKAVLDTNVIVSGIISPKGAPRKILELAIDGKFKVLSSPSINKEVLMVLCRKSIYSKYNLTEEIINAISDFLYETTILTDETYNLQIIKEDPQDNIFINCAVEGKANYIVTGDKHLLSLKNYSKIEIVSPTRFLQILKEIKTNFLAQ